MLAGPRAEPSEGDAMRWIMTMGLVTLTAATGCKGDASDEDYDDIATALGALVANDSGGEIGSMHDGEALASGETGDLSSMGSGSFEGARLGLSYHYEITCKDEGDNVLDPCDTTTETAQLVVEWHGELDLPRYDASITRTGDFALSGLQSDTAEFNGHGTFDVETEFTALFRDVQRSFLLDYDGDYAGVKWDRATKRPLAGTITYDVHAQRITSRGNRETEVELDVLAVIEFSENGTASLTLDSERRYSLDLDSGQVAKK
jgi:hypothetical protein